MTTTARWRTSSPCRTRSRERSPRRWSCGSHRARRRRRAQRTPNLEAYDLYLRALYLRTRLSADALRQATDLLDRAIELSPEFALAYAAKASVIGPRIYFRYLPREEGVREMRAAVARALELDPNLGEAYVALGILKLFYEWDWPSAEHALRRGSPAERE